MGGAVPNHTGGQQVRSGVSANFPDVTCHSYHSRQTDRMPEPASRSRRLANLPTTVTAILVAPHDPSSVSQLPPLQWTNGISTRLSGCRQLIFQPRLAMIDDTVGGYRIRRGTLIGISIYAMRRDPRWWVPDAHSYQPMRFYDKDIVAARPNLAVMAFCGRPHRRFGAAGPSGTIPACRGRSRGRAYRTYQSGRPSDKEVSATWASPPAPGNPFGDAADPHAPTRSKTASGCQVRFRSVDSERLPMKMSRHRRKLAADQHHRHRGCGGHRVERRPEKRWRALHHHVLATTRRPHLQHRTAWKSSACRWLHRNVDLHGTEKRRRRDQSPLPGREYVQHLVRITRELPEIPGEPPRLYVVTRAAQAVVAGDVANLEQARSAASQRGQACIRLRHRRTRYPRTLTPIMVQNGAAGRGALRTLGDIATPPPWL
jgi:hypothetical protein